MKLFLKIEALFPSLFLFTLFIVNRSSSAESPGLKDVLTQQSFSFNWAAVLLGVLLILTSGAVFFAAKTYMGHRKNKKKDNEEAVEKKDSFISEVEAKLSFVSAELKSKEMESENLKNELKKMNEIIGERIKNEELLKKSAIELRKEQGKILAEKDRLSQELSRQNSSKLFGAHDIDIEEIIVVEGDVFGKEKNRKTEKEAQDRGELALKQIIQDETKKNKKSKILKKKNGRKKKVEIQ